MAKNNTNLPPLTPNPILENLWDSALDAYRDYPQTALVMAQNFRALQDALATKNGAQHVIRALDRGIERLFRYSEFYTAGRDLFELAVAGELKPEHDLFKLADAARQATKRKAGRASA